MIELNGISLSYGKHQVLDRLNLRIQENRINCILGPSGCGKSSILNLISGLIKPDSGTIHNQPAQVSYIFQDLRIIPWMTVLENIRFPLKGKMTQDQITIQARRYLEHVGLWQQRDAYPAQLSGGMKQRVSIARAFAFPSSVILMDEAFQGLDIVLKTRILDEFVKSWEDEPRTVLFVTHDLDEAFQIGQELVVLNARPSGDPYQVRLTDAPDIKRRIPSDLKEMVIHQLNQ